MKFERALISITVCLIAIAGIVCAVWRIVDLTISVIY